MTRGVFLWLAMLSFAVVGCTMGGGDDDDDCDGSECDPKHVDGTCAEEIMDCTDLIGANAGAQASAWDAENDAVTNVSVIQSGYDNGPALRVETTAGLEPITIRYEFSGPAIDTSGAGYMRLVARASNTNPMTWQEAAPVVRIQDDNGFSQTMTPGAAFLPDDGKTWREIRVPFATDESWTVSGQQIDREHVRAIELRIDTWGYGFSVDLDALSFVPAAAVCGTKCDRSCGEHGQCQLRTGTCECDIGYAGDDCGECSEGFVRDDDVCNLSETRPFDYWPNEASLGNSDAWLALHHEDIVTVRPKLLVLNFHNPTDLDALRTVVQEQIAIIGEASRPRGYDDSRAVPQVEYEIAALKDLRDGVNGRPDAPGTWEYENSQLLPRIADAEEGADQLDYDGLFTEGLAEEVGVEDPTTPGQVLTVCGAINQGLINEVWVAASTAESEMIWASVRERKQRYAAGGVKIDGEFDSCAGEGCLGAEANECARSVRVLVIDPTNPCVLDPLARSLRRTARSRIVPRLSSWFLRFEGSDLDAQYGLPFTSIDQLICLDIEGCIEYPSPRMAVLSYLGRPFEVPEYDPVCGTIEVPPNGTATNQYQNSQPVQSSCYAFGQATCEEPAAMRDITASEWSRNTTVADEACGGSGKFLMWWFQNLPAHGTGQTLPWGTRMLSAWPFLYY